MGHGHDHSARRTANASRLKLALILTGTFLIVEVVGGLLTKSLALLSDAAHMFTDASGLAIALAAVKIAERPADAKRTFGYARFEILAAALNAILLFLVAIYILYEAWKRFAYPVEVASLPMLLVAVFGLIINFICMKILDEGKDESLNVKGAYLEVWADMIGSAGVIAAAVVIWITGWDWIDLVAAVAIGLWVLPRTWQLLSESLNILLQGVPAGLHLEEIERELRALPGVTGLHSLHVWSLTSGQNVLSAHIEIEKPIEDAMVLRQRCETMLHERFKIDHTTIQIEDCSASCGQVQGRGGHTHDHGDHSH